MDTAYRMLFDEVRHALQELRDQHYLEAQRTLEGVVLMDDFIRHYRRRDAHAIRIGRIVSHLEWEHTPEGRLEWRRWWDRLTPEEQRHWERYRTDPIMPEERIDVAKHDWEVHRGLR